MEEVATITSNGKQLNVIYSKMKYGLYTFFSSDEGLAEYITREPEKAFLEAVSEDDEGICWLNIASTENFGYFEHWSGMSTLLNRQLTAFMPVVQKFIEYAATGQFEVRVITDQE